MERQARDNGPGRAETAVRQGSLLIGFHVQRRYNSGGPFRPARDGLIDQLDSPLPVTKLRH
jgi:hypothetical protein